MKGIGYNTHLVGQEKGNTVCGEGVGVQVKVWHIFSIWKGCKAFSSQGWLQAASRIGGEEKCCGACKHL